MKTAPRLLWLAASLMPAMARKVKAPHAMVAPWIARLLEEVKTHMDCEVCIAAPFAVPQRIDFREDGVRYVILPRPRRAHYWTYSFAGLSAAAELIDEYRPSLTHVHGSESFLGLAHTKAAHAAPTILSLQGLLNTIVPHALGGLTPWEVFTQEHPIDLLRMSGVLGMRRTWRAGATIEREVLNAHSHIIGHTAWDQSQLVALNPSAHYHRVGEPLRHEFFRTRWSRSMCKPFTVFFGNLAGAHKGGYTVLRSLSLLEKDFPDLQFRVAGRLGAARGYGRMFLNEAARLGVAQRVTFLGFLDAATMASELASSHVFVSASYIDNNPNSVGEAQAVGTPTVASYVGGVPEMLDDGRSGLLFPAGDSAMLAQQIARVFMKDSLADALSAAGQQQAAKRHDSKIILEELLQAYSWAGCELSRVTNR